MNPKQKAVENVKSYLDKRVEKNNHKLLDYRDREKVLGELVDIWHFVLSWENNFNYSRRLLFSKDYFIEDVKDILWSLENNKGMIVQRFTQLTHYPIRKVETLIAITEYLGFSVEDVYQAYCDKNKINYQRLESGY